MPHNLRRYSGPFAHAGLQRARESAVAATARRAAKLLETQGLANDRHLVHVNDEELSAIRGAFGRNGGVGRRNPVTGLESFTPEGDASLEMLAHAGPIGGGIFDGAPHRVLSSRSAVEDSALNVLRSIPAYKPSVDTVGYYPEDDTGYAPPDSHLLAQELLPLFARPPILTPRILRPLEELPRGESGGEGAGKRFPDSIGDEPGTPCTYCTRPTTDEPGPDKLHRDHDVPRSQEGNNSEDNYAPACQTCNLQKGPRTPDQWYKDIGKAGESSTDSASDNHD